MSCSSTEPEISIMNPPATRPSCRGQSLELAPPHSSSDQPTTQPHSTRKDSTSSTPLDSALKAASSTSSSGDPVSGNSNNEKRSRKAVVLSPTGSPTQQFPAVQSPLGVMASSGGSVDGRQSPGALTTTETGAVFTQDYNGNADASIPGLDGLSCSLTQEVQITPAAMSASTGTPSLPLDGIFMNGDNLEDSGSSAGADRRSSRESSRGTSAMTNSNSRPVVYNVYLGEGYTSQWEMIKAKFFGWQATREEAEDSLQSMKSDPEEMMRLATTLTSLMYDISAASQENASPFGSVMSGDDRRQRYSATSNKDGKRGSNSFRSGFHFGGSITNVLAHRRSTTNLSHSTGSTMTNAVSGGTAVYSKSRKSSMVGLANFGPASVGTTRRDLPHLFSNNASRAVSRAASITSLPDEHEFTSTDQVRKEGADDDDETGDGDVIASVNQYMLLDELGRGAQGIVYLGFDNNLQEFRAIKAIKRPLETSQLMKQIRQEVEITRNLRHKNIIRLYELLDDVKDKKMYLVLQFAEKGQLVKYKTPAQTSCEIIDPVDFIYYARQLCAGLTYLHRHRVFHHDIKPDNILLGVNDQVFLADFGLSSTDDFDGELSTTFSSTKGTPAFFAPEQMDGTPEAWLDQGKCDVWALGVTFFLFLCGCFPKYKSTQPPPPPTCSSAASALPTCEKKSKSSPRVLDIKIAEADDALTASLKSPTKVKEHGGTPTKSQLDPLSPVWVPDTPTGPDTRKSSAASPFLASMHDRRMCGASSNSIKSKSSTVGTSESTAADLEASEVVEPNDEGEDLLTLFVGDLDTENNPGGASPKSLEQQKKNAMKHRKEIIWPSTLPLQWRRVLEGMLQIDAKERWSIEKARKAVKALKADEMGMATEEEIEAFEKEKEKDRLSQSIQGSLSNQVVSGPTALDSSTLQKMKVETDLHGSGSFEVFSDAGDDEPETTRPLAVPGDPGEATTTTGVTTARPSVAGLDGKAEEDLSDTDDDDDDDDSVDSEPPMRRCCTGASPDHAHATTCNTPGLFTSSSSGGGFKSPPSLDASLSNSVLSSSLPPIRSPVEQVAPAPLLGGLDGFGASTSGRLDYTPPVALTGGTSPKDAGSLQPTVVKPHPPSNPQGGITASSRSRSTSPSTRSLPMSAGIPVVDDDGIWSPVGGNGGVSSSGGGGGGKARPAGPLPPLSGSIGGNGARPITPRSELNQPPALQQVLAQLAPLGGSGLMPPSAVDSLRGSTNPSNSRSTELTPSALDLEIQRSPNFGAELYPAAGPSPPASSRQAAERFTRSPQRARVSPSQTLPRSTDTVGDDSVPEL